MSGFISKLLGIGGALVITVAVFGFFFFIVSQLPQPKPTVVTVDIFPAKAKP